MRTAKQDRLATIGFALGVYVIWVLATYLLEGRVNLLQRGTPIGRALYTVIANIVIGIGLSAWLFLRAKRTGIVSPEALGFRNSNRALVAVVIAAVVGLALFIAQRPASTRPMVLLNVFDQVWPTSVAEVLVVWVAVGAILDGFLRSRALSRTVSTILAVVVADILFSIYHFAHSAPFNQVGVVMFLMLPGLATSLVYFLGRDVYATIVFHNFLGMFGVMRNINLDAFSRFLLPLFLLALISILAVIAIHRLVAASARASSG
jgi:CAAX prenyl protease-like protein